jgi:N-acetylglucosamine malate deacetylase 1
MDAFEAPLPTFPAPLPPTIEKKPPAPAAKTVLIFSPHPDDECIMGVLPLRFQREQGCRIVNIAVTLGSNPARREARRSELEAACARLGWENVVLEWEGVKPGTVHPSHETFQPLFEKYQPAAVFYPHAHDGHPTHIGVHQMVVQTLHAQPGSGSCLRFQTEYWHPMEHPNLLIECPPDDLALLIEALACHRGEVERNPYHRTLPATLMDNVRRGSERVYGAGKPATAFPFGALYRVDPSPAMSPTGIPLLGGG